MIIPAEINFIYYDFFSKNSHVFWSDKFWTFYMIDYMYDYKYQNLIGMNYFFHNNNNWVNTGWIGTSYMHANYIGLIVYAIIIAIIFSYLDYIAKKKEAKFTILLTFIPIMILFILSDLSTVIINHGLLIAFILLLLISPSNTKKY